MKNSIFHKSLLFLILILSFSFFLTIIQAAPQNTENSKKQIVVSLRQKAKKALLSGNKKQADIYWQQANSLESQKSKPVWLQKGITNSNNSNNQLPILEEKKFIKLLNEMPYEKAKIELDKRLVFSPNNTKLRLVYLELAQKNNDEIEIERHSKLLGIKQPKTFNYKLLFKYFLAIVITLLIFYEIIKMFRTSKNKE